MPLSMKNPGEEGTIKKVEGTGETRRFLENLGFVIGAGVKVESDFGGNMIVNIRDLCVAINSDIAMKIIVE